MPSQHPASVTDPQPCQLPARDQGATTIVVDGYGASISVDRGRLRVDDGLGQERRSLLLSRGTCKINRVLILAVTGSISLSALRWCEDLSISVLALNRDNSVTMRAGPPGNDDARLRRAQALALTNDQGVDITRYLLGRKVHGQRDTLAHFGRQDQRISSLCDAIEQATTINACLSVEAEAASRYWQQWRQFPLQWQNPDWVPTHWKTAGTRLSPKTGNARDAVTPAHAVISYCYRLAEIETTIAIRAVGLDPGLGIFHTDKPNRDSMTLDCLEAIRPTVDRYVLGLLETRTLTRRDVIERTDGTVRLLPPLSHELAQTMPQWRTAVAPVIEQVAHLLRPVNAIGRKIKRTPLSNANKRQVQTVIKASHGIETASKPATNGYVPRREDWFTSLHPFVRDVATAELVRATGLSKCYIKQIKRGDRVPDPKHWHAFRQAAT